MRVFLSSFLRFVGLYFVLQTFVLYGLGYTEARWIWFLSKDVLRFVFVLYMLFSYRNFLLTWIRRYWSLLLVLLGLSVWTLYASLGTDLSVFDFFVGRKYDWFYLVILASSLFVGFALGRSGEWSGSKFVVSLCYLCLGLVLGGFLWQALKLYFPDFFIQYLGYGGFGDFLPGSKPPLYYLTGSGGVTRLSGLFTGPNVLGFFLVLFGGLQFWFVRHRIRFAKWLFFLLIVFALLLTLSRGAVVAFSIVSVLSILFLGKHTFWKKVFFSLLVLIVGGGSVYLINFTKTGSNLERGSGLEASQELLEKNIWGYGVGFTGPAQHYRDDYVLREKHPLSLLENIYMQLLVNLGLPGFVLWCLFWLLLFVKVVRVVRICLLGSESEYVIGVALLLMTFGLFALLVEGLVLHVFRDSSLNYLFFVSYGVLLGYADYKKRYSAALSREYIW